MSRIPLVRTNVPGSGRAGRVGSLLALVAIFALGCMPHHVPQQAYSGDPRPLSELSMVVAGHGKGKTRLDMTLEDAMDEVVIWSIDGEETIEEWRAYERRPLLAPGEHELGVGPLRRTSVDGMFDSWARENDSRRKLQVLELETEAGFAYRIHQGSWPPRYYVVRVPIEEGAAPAPIDPPEGAFECSALGDPDTTFPRLDCGRGVASPTTAARVTD